MAMRRGTERGGKRGKKKSGRRRREEMRLLDRMIVAIQ